MSRPTGKSIRNYNTEGCIAYFYKNIEVCLNISKICSLNIYEFPIKSRIMILYRYSVEIVKNICRIHLENLICEGGSKKWN